MKGIHQRINETSHMKMENILAIYVTAIQHFKIGFFHSDS